MTTHVFIVDETTFPIHLQYMFAGTGSRDKTFGLALNNQYKWTTESGLVEMVADGERVREGDFIIFYLQQNKSNEGGFYGIFQAVDNGIFLEDVSPNQYLKDKLVKNLTFRLKIRPYEVYAKGVTEWEALDVIKGLQAPYQILWSLIYRKLKGNRGNTMITIYEAERLFALIRQNNNRQPLPMGNYDYQNGQIVLSNHGKIYMGNTLPIDITPRLINKYNTRKAHEAHLQAYITKYVGLGIKPTLDSSIGIVPQNINWIGNEVSCGVGMQRIDVLVEQSTGEIHNELLPIELKCVEATPYNVNQIQRYIEWLEQYYIPNRRSCDIQPILICHQPRKPLSPNGVVWNSFLQFDNQYAQRCAPLRYIEYQVYNNDIVFNRIK